MVTYLIPTTFASHNVPMRYRVVIRRRDMRTSFCRKYDCHTIDSSRLQELIVKYGLTMRGDILIMKNGRSAYYFNKEVR